MNNLAVFLKNSACEPYKVFHSYMNNKRLGGFHLVDVYLTSNGRLALERKKNKLITFRKNIALLGQGAEGIAFVGCVDDKCKQMVVIKSAKSGLKLEYKVMMRIFKASPHITVPYMFSKCPREEILYQEYENGGDLLDLITNYHRVIQPIHLKTIIFQILITLLTLHKKFPTFRHNDIHLKNILVDLSFKSTGSTKYKNFYVPNIGLRAVLNDFGFANMDGIPNPKVVSKQYAKDYGIAPDSDKMFDVHFFLNALYIDCAKHPEFIEALSFITSVVPQKYLGDRTTHVKNSRLRYGVSHSDFPSFSRLLYHPYFKEFTKVRTNATNFVNVNTPPPVVMNFKLPRPKQKSPNKPKPKTKTPSPVKVPSPPRKASDECGKKAQPVTGVGAQKLTTQQMIDLIKRRGHQVPKGQPSRQELCAVIQEHKLKVTPEYEKPRPKPVPAAMLPSAAPAGIKNFLASQNVVVEKPNPAPAPVAVPYLSEAKLWQLYQKKLTENIYNTMPKNGEYQDRMDEASKKAREKIKDMQKKGEKAPPYYAKK